MLSLALLLIRVLGRCRNRVPPSRASVQTLRTSLLQISFARPDHSLFPGGTFVAKIVGMSRDYIEFISAYCDRRCERCPFTSRCSAYAVEIATAMCDGDFGAGLELAVGLAATPGGPADDRPELDLPDEQPSEAEIARFAREQDARDERVDQSPVTTLSTVVLLLARRWLGAHRERLAAGPDPALSEAVDTMGWDSHLIPVKLRRALRGRDAARTGEGSSDDRPVQNDWNGSAKVALISIERSLAACRRIASATGDEDAAHLADRIAALRDVVRGEFPDADRFVRPGFDDGGRRQTIP